MIAGVLCVLWGGLFLAVGAFGTVDAKRTLCVLSGLAAMALTTVVLDMDLPPELARGKKATADADESARRWARCAPLLAIMALDAFACAYSKAKIIRINSHATLSFHSGA